MGSYNQRSPCGSQPSDMTYQNNRSNHRDNLNFAQLLMSLNNAAESYLSIYLSHCQKGAMLIDQSSDSGPN